MAIWGFVIGDALGVPVEFSSRAELESAPVTDMMGYGTYHQPPGTWSDDSSMMLCTLENLLENGNHTDLSYKFVQWYDQAYMTPFQEVFDIGNTTRAAIQNLMDGIPWHQSGITEERIACGNGSLMRILPFAFFNSYTGENLAMERYKMIAHAGSITHAHPLPHLCAFFYVELVLALTTGASKSVALNIARDSVAECLLQWEDRNQAADLSGKMQRILTADFAVISASEIRSSGYVIYTLEAALWCWLRGSGYREIVLSAVNLGEDTDTVAAVAGALAALSHGIDAEWQSRVANQSLITSLLDSI